MDNDLTTDDLLQRAQVGDEQAVSLLLDQYRDTVHRAVALRLDRRLAARVDASDIVQETYMEALRRLPEFLRQRPIPFALWLRWLAQEQVLQCHRRHLGAELRDVRRELGPLPEDASSVFVRALAGRGPSPSRHAAEAETAEKLRAALDVLEDEERELILWRHFEQLSNREAALLLGVTEPAASKRYVRALERLRGFLERLGVTGE